MSLTALTPYPWPAFGSRPLLGANGTDAMLALLSQGGTDLVDYLKVGPFMGTQAIAELASHHPLMLHLDDTLSGHTPLPDQAVERILDWVQLTGTPWTSEHIGFSVPDVTLDKALVTQAASDLLSRKQALHNIKRNALALAQSLPVPLLLENVPLFPNLAHMHICEPDFIAEVIEDTGCEILLDLAHARVSADVLGYDVHDYLLRLPLTRVVELHLSGPRPARETDARRRALVRRNARSIAHLIHFGDHNLVDAHESLQEEDYALLEWVLACTQPRAISLEYFRRPEPLHEQLVRLGEILGR